MIKFNVTYFILTVLFFCIEVLIALFVHDNFIRPYLGDVLVVILLYCFFKSFLKLPVIIIALFVLGFSFLIEFLQYLNFVEILGWQKSRLATTVLGNSFSWGDIIAYVFGTMLILSFENHAARKQPINKS